MTQTFKLILDKPTRSIAPRISPRLSAAKFAPRPVSMPVGKAPGLEEGERRVGAARNTHLPSAPREGRRV